jgi:hypothetical protein
MLSGRCIYGRITAVLNSSLNMHACVEVLGSLRMARSKKLMQAFVGWKPMTGEKVVARIYKTAHPSAEHAGCLRLREYEAGFGAAAIGNVPKLGDRGEGEA